MGERINLIYLLIHKRLHEKFKEEEIKLEELFKVICKVHGINKQYRYLVLKELEEMKLVKRINSNYIKTLPPLINLDESSKLYQSIGMY